MSQEDGAQIRPQDRQFLGHPIGLWVLFTTEMWERFCYYGMRAFLVLYLTSTLTGTNPGFGWTEKEAYNLYGWFTGLVYFFPLFGGYIADRLIGEHRSVLFGGILIALGELALWATEIFRCHAQTAVTFASAPAAFLTFFLGLALITLGTGFFKPCISVMVGQLYPPNDKRRDAAFTYFYMGINVGALLAPFAAGTVAEKYGWHWGFLVASIGMIFGICTYSIFRPKYLGHIGKVSHKREVSAGNDPNGAISRSLSRKEIDRVAVIVILSIFCIAFWSVYEQAGSSLTTFAKRETNRVVPSRIGEKFSTVFLSNEDEIDAEKSLAEVRRNVLKAAAALERIEKEKVIAQSQQLEDWRTYSGYLQAADDYHTVSNEVRESLDLTENAILKANTARQKIGLEPIALSIPSDSELLETAKKDEERIAKRAEAEGRNVNDILREENFEAEKKRQAERDPVSTIWTFPSTWYQSLNPFWIVVLGPLFAGLWSFLGKRNLEPSTPVKFGIGLLILSFAYLFMIGGAIHAENTSGNAAAVWLLGTYVFCTLGELCLSPVGLSMVTRLAPPKFASCLMGTWFLSSAVAGYLSGALAAFLGTGDTLSFCFKKGLADYFFVMAIVPFLAAILMFCLAPVLRKMMHED